MLLVKLAECDNQVVVVAGLVLEFRRDPGHVVRAVRAGLGQQIRVVGRVGEPHHLVRGPVRGARVVAKCSSYAVVDFVEDATCVAAVVLVVELLDQHRLQWCCQVLAFDSRCEDGKQRIQYPRGAHLRRAGRSSEIGRGDDGNYQRRVGRFVLHLLQQSSSRREAGSTLRCVEHVLRRELASEEQNRIDELADIGFVVTSVTDKDSS